jgi:hypothetical protein
VHRVCLMPQEKWPERPRSDAEIMSAVRRAPSMARYPNLPANKASRACEGERLREITNTWVRSRSSAPCRTLRQDWSGARGAGQNGANTQPPTPISPGDE